VETKICSDSLVPFLTLLGCNCDIADVWHKLETACSQHWPANVVRKIWQLLKLVESETSWERTKEPWTTFVSKTLTVRLEDYI